MDDDYDDYDGYDGERGFDDGYDGKQVSEREAENPFYAAGYREGYLEAEEELARDGDRPAGWAVENYRAVCEAQGWTESEPKRTETADDSEWRREQANEAGMAFGCNAFNEIMGWD